MTLDDAMFLASSYINIAYEEFQTLLKDGLLKIVPKKGGSYDIKLMRLDKITQKILPRIITAFQQFEVMLQEKERETLTPITAGHVG